MNGCLHLRAVVPGADDFRWDWTEDVGALDRMLWPVAQSAAELLVSGDLADVRQCNATGCFRLFVSRSKRRLWCDMNTCGNRAKGRRYQRFLRQVKEGALQQKPASSPGSGDSPSSSVAGRETPEVEIPATPSATERLDAAFSTDAGRAERSVASQPTAFDDVERLDVVMTTELRPEDRLEAAPPTHLEPEDRLDDAHPTGSKT